MKAETAVQVGLSPSRLRPLDAAVLNIDDRERTNLFPWRGQFSPQLVESLLGEYGPAPGGLVLDPFVGSGTVAIESALLGRAVVGFDINPAAAILAKVYEFCNVASPRRAEILVAVEEHLDLGGEAGLPLFSGVASTSTISAEVLADRDVPFANRILLDALVVLSEFSGDEVEVERLRPIWWRLKSTVASLPHTPRCLQIAMADARRLPLADGSVDFVCSSPPYINVFNYHQQHRPSVEFLGWDVLGVARSELGSNRKHRGNRLLTVTQYCIDMASCLSELKRVCHARSRVVLVVGRESNVRKTAFFNGAIIKRVARESVGFDLVLEQERVFKNKFGRSIYEDILILEPRSRGPMTDARLIASEALMEARSRAPSDVLADFDEAIERVEAVRPSSMFGQPPDHLWAGEVLT